MNSNLEEEQRERNSIVGIISIVIALVMAALIINFLTGIIRMEKLQGLPMIMPLFFAPIGVIIGFVSYKIKHDKFYLFGIILNMIIFFIPFIYHIFGVLIFGV